MRTDTKKAICDLFLTFDISSSNALPYLELHYACCLLCSLKNGPEPYSAHLNDRYFYGLYTAYGLSHPPLFHRDFSLYRTQIDCLCQALADADLLNTRKFLRNFFPFILQSPTAYFSIFASNTKRIPELLSLLVLLNFAQKIIPSEQLTSDCEALYHRFCDETPREITDSLFRDSGHFCRCWQAIFLHPLTHIPVKTNGNIASAIRRFQKEKVPLTHLLQDIHDIKLHRNKLENAINPWLVSQRNIKKFPVEGGLTTEETLFEKASFLLKDERPTDLIRSIFYPPSRNDSALECSFVFSEFAEQVAPCHSAIVVNPSPDFLITWFGDSRTRDKSACFICVSSVVADLYHLQFPSAQFLSLTDDTFSLKPQDSLLIFGRDLQDDLLGKALSTLNYVTENAPVLALIPSASIRHEALHFHQKLQSSRCIPEHILLLPSSVSKSSPRTKALFFLRKIAAEQSIGHYSVAFYESTCSSDNCLCISSKFTLVPSCIFEQKLTLSAMMKESSAPPLPPKRSRSAPNSYSFSPEISLQYTIQSDKHGAFAGKAYYCESRSADNTHRQRGKRLTPFIEKGLRAKTQEDVLSKLELLPFDPRMEPYIISDLHQCYVNELHTLSLKTIWFCCRPELQQRPAYHDDLSKELFCGGTQNLSNLVPFSAKDSDFQQCMSAVFHTNWDDIPLAYWKQLDLILHYAAQSGYIYQNPVSGLMPILSTQASQTQREVRNALTKKSFTNEEEWRMVRFLMAPTKEKVALRNVRRYESDSLLLAGAIRLFTGMSTREVCALTWRDFVKIPETDRYQLLISKFVDSTGTLASHMAQDDWLKFRRIPLPPLLASMLNSRRFFLEMQGADPNFFADAPIIQPSKSISSAVQTAQFCTPKKVYKACKAILTAAKIPQQSLLLPGQQTDKTVDIYRYQGDIFQSNFKYRANHACGLTRGELCYILGNTPPDTFSRNYCDYANDLIQYATSVKLQRWTEQFHCLLNAASSQPDTHCNCFDIILQPKEPCTIMLSVKHQFGFSGYYTIQEQGVEV